MLLGILRDQENLASKVLNDLDIELDICRKEILSEIDPHYESGDMETASAGSSTSENPKGNLKTPALKSFGRELTELAAQGKLDPVIGRSKEIARMIQILCRRTKNNPILIGELVLVKLQSLKVLLKKLIWELFLRCC